MIVSKSEYEKDPSKYRCVEVKSGKMKGRMMYLTKIKEEEEVPDVVEEVVVKKTRKKRVIEE